MDKPILSICIPTYNRSHYLKNALESIYTQLKNNPELSHSVEVAVSNNASTDNTEAVAESYRPLFENYVYSASDANYGCDENYLRVVDIARGEYIWFLGDDDTIVDGAIAHIVSLLSTHKYDVGGVEAIAENHSLPLNTQHNPTEWETDITDDKNEYFFKGYCRGALSSVIVSRQKMIDLVDRNDYMEYWLYYEAALRILGSTTKKQFFVKTPMVITGQDCRWIEDGGELFTYVNSNTLHMRMLNWGYDKARIERYVDDNYKKLPLIVLRAKGNDLELSLKNFMFMLKGSRGASPITISASVLIFYVPNKLVVLVRDGRKRAMKLLAHS